MKARLYKVRYSLRKFIELEAFSSIILLSSTLLAMVLVNSGWEASYSAFLSFKFLNLSMEHWINDGLMTIFFFVIGLELKKEIVQGELNNPRKAALPVFAAIGGMVLPALIYLCINREGDFRSGWGIPMATDIAFALGALTLFGKKIPLSLKIFLLAVAIVDDLGAILVIAFFYTAQINYLYLFLAFIFLFFIHLLKLKQFKSYLLYCLFGFIVWFFTLRSGIHATIAGVLIGLLTPYATELKKSAVDIYSPVEELISILHPFVSYGILPLFAFANAGIYLTNIEIGSLFKHTIFQGILTGLVIGKPVGIMLFSFIAVKLKLAHLGKGLNWPDIFCVSILAGIGFTMSLFISNLALSDDLEIFSKTSIVLSSALSAFLGIIIMFLNLRYRNQIVHHN